MEKEVGRFMRYQRAEGHSPKTIDNYLDVFKQFRKWLAETGRTEDLDALDVDTVREWITYLREAGRSDSTVANRVRALKAFTRWLEAEEWVNKDPLRRLKQPKETQKPKGHFTPAEVDRILASCDRNTITGLRDYAIFLLMYSTGLRAEEICGLHIGDIDYTQGLISIRRGKGGKARLVPLGAKVDRAIDKYLAKREDDTEDPERPLFTKDDLGPIQASTLKMISRRTTRRAKLHVNPHKFRHSFAIEYLRGGGKIETLKLIMGHSTLDMTLHYARIAGVDLADAHELADPTKRLKSR